MRLPRVVEPLRHREFVLEHVDCDYLARARDSASLDTRQTHAASAEDRDCGARLETVPVFISYADFELVNIVTFDHVDVSGTVSGPIEPD